MKRLLLIVLLLSAAASATTRTAADCNVGSVQTQINASVDGDTVIIPSGNCTWASGISTTKQITIQGVTVPTRTKFATDGTTINYGAGSSGTTLLTVSIGASFRTQIANIRFVVGNASGGVGRYVIVNGSGKAPLMHDVYFDLDADQLFHAVEWNVTGGVIWNATFDSNRNLGGACGTTVGASQGDIVLKPGISWDAASTMGTLDTTGENNTYIEDSIFSYVGQTPDVDDGGRVVLRHNQYIGSSGLTHGPTSTTGGRQVEMYDNTFVPFDSRSSNARDIGSRYFWMRAGTAVFTGNAITNPQNACHGGVSSLQFIVEDATRITSHGCCTSWMCFHQPGSGIGGSTGSNGGDTSQRSDPIYMWGNTGTGDTSGLMTSINNSDLTCNTGNTTGTFFQSGRDYFYDGSHTSAGAKSGWTRYTYPHPLHSGSPAPVLPTVSFTAPGNGNNVSGASVTVSATASTTSGTIAGVSFFYTPTAGGATTQIGVEDTVSPYSVTWNTTSLANIDYTLTAQARGSNGGTNNATIQVHVANSQTLGSANVDCVSPCNTDGINQTLIAGGSTGTVVAHCFDTSAVSMNCASASPVLVFQSGNTAFATVTNGAACGTQDWCATVTPLQATTGVQITASNGTVTSTPMTLTVTPSSSTMLLSKQTGARYLYANGHAVMLSGGHTFNDVQDVSTQNTGTINAYTDFPGYLAWLKGFGHNYLRLWVNLVYKGSPNGNFTETNVPQPYARCDDAGATACPNGTLASDGLKKFDLNTFNPIYFNSLVSRVAQAQAQGFYVSDMLFNAWSEFDGCEIGMSPCGNPWTNHPYRSANNIQGFNGDTLGTNDGWAMYNNPSVTSPTVWAKMQLLIHHHVDLLHTYDNVMFEPSNEPTYAFSAESGFTYAKILAWGNLVANDIASYETAQGYVHHPVFVEAFDGDTITGAALTTRTNTLPPLVTTSGVVTMIDTDHMTDVAGGVTVDATWKRFTRGPGIMALLDPPAGQPETSTDPVRRAYGNIRSYANRMVLDVGRTVPWDNTVSNGGSGKCTTAFCLVDPGHTYLMYYPSGGSANLTITTVDAGGCEWFNAATSALLACTFQGINAAHTYTAPSGCTQCVLFVGGTGPTTDTTPPTASFVPPTPVAGSNVEGTFTMSVSASDNVAVSSVSFTVDGVTTAVVGSAPYSFTATTLSYPADPVCANTTFATCGNHVLGCFAKDTSNLQGFCATRTVQFVTTPPPPPGTPGGPSTIKGSIMMGGRVK